MNEKEYIDALEAAGYVFTQNGKGGYSVTYPTDPGWQITVSNEQDLRGLYNEARTLGRVAEGGAEAGLPEGVVEYNGKYWQQDSLGQWRILGSVSATPKATATTFPTEKDAYDYMDRTGAGAGLKPVWNSAEGGYVIEEIPSQKPTIQLIDRGADELGRPYDDYGYTDEEGNPVVTSRKYTDMPKQAQQSAQYLGGGIDELGRPYDLYGFMQDGQQVITSKEYTQRPETPKTGLAAPEFQQDPGSGQWFMRTTPEGAWEPFNAYIPSLNQQIDQALIQGNRPLAQSLKDFRDQPTPAEALRLSMEIMQSPGDWWTYMKLSRGTQPNVPYDVGGEAIPRTGLQGFQAPSLLPGGQSFAPPLTGPQVSGVPALPAPRIEDIKRQEAMRKWALNPPATTMTPPTPPAITGRRPYLMEGDIGYEQRRYLTDAEVAQLKSQGLGSQILWEETPDIPAPPALPSAGYVGHETERPPGLGTPTMAQRLTAYQQSLKPPGYQYNPIDANQGYETIYGVPIDPSRRAGYVAPRPELAQTLASPTQAQQELAVPSFLQSLAQGQNVGRARQMPTLGFPNFLSRQGWQNLTTPEQEILQSEVKAQGGYWPQYAREMQDLWPKWTKRGAFLRQPGFIGV